MLRERLAPRVSSPVGSPGRSAGLSLFLSLSQSQSLLDARPAKRVFLFGFLVFDCLVAHVKTKCPTHNAISTRSREKTEPNPKKTFFVSFCSTFVHTIMERDVTFPQHRTALFCASANSILSPLLLCQQGRSLRTERIFQHFCPSISSPRETLRESRWERKSAEPAAERERERERGRGEE